MGEQPMIYAIASLQYCTGVGKEPRRSVAGASAIDRLQMIASHWSGHVGELRGQT